MWAGDCGDIERVLAQVRKFSGCFAEEELEEEPKITIHITYPEDFSFQIAREVQKALEDAIRNIDIVDPKVPRDPRDALQDVGAEFFEWLDRYFPLQRNWDREIFGWSWSYFKRNAICKIGQLIREALREK